MGTASIVLGILGISICWTPGIGWLGALMGVLGCALGIPSITHWFHKPGYTPWGISGLILGVTAADLSTAFQYKHAGGALDGLFIPVAPGNAALISIGAVALCAGGLVLARTKSRAGGIFISAIALLAIIGVSTAGLITADTAHEAALRTAALK